MSFTIIQSISLDEESSSKTELSKKSDPEPKDESEKDTDTDGEDEMNELLNGYFKFNITAFTISPELYEFGNPNCLSSYVNITTPPPKIKIV